MKKVFFFIFAIFLFLSCSKEVKTFSIGIDPSYFQKFKELGSDVYGYMQEVLLEISKEENIDFDLIKLNKDQLNTFFMQKKVDGIFSSKKPYMFEKEKYDFSLPLLETGYLLTVKKGSKIKSLDDLDNKLVGIVKNESSLYFLKEKVMVKEYDDISNLLNNLSSSYLDAALIDSVIAQSYIDNIYSDLEAREFLGDSSIYIIALKKEGIILQSEDLIKRIDEAIEKLKEKSILEKLKKKWGIL